MVQSILQEKGHTFVIKLLHASVFSLPSYMLSDIADVIIELVQHDREVRTRMVHSIFHFLVYEFRLYLFSQLTSKWLEEAIKTMPPQNASGSPTATPEQLLEFHNTITR